MTLRAEFEGGAVTTTGAGSRIVDRFTGNGKVRGFEANGYGPRDLTAVNQDALGGNLFWSARVETQFPIGLPEEYGLTGGLFADVGSGAYAFAAIATGTLASTRRRTRCGSPGSPTRAASPSPSCRRCRSAARSSCSIRPPRRCSKGILARSPIRSARR